MYQLSQKRARHEAVAVVTNGLLLDFKPDAAAADATAVSTTDSAAAVATVTNGLSIIANIAAAADPWSLNTDGTMRTPAVGQMAKGSAGEAGHQCYSPRRKHQHAGSSSPCCC